MKLVKYIILLISTCFVATTLQGQVKIGSSTPPMKGALLELSQGKTTTKGLMLPRVSLTDLNSLADIIPAAATRPDPVAHIGLMVYNVNTIGECITIPPGVFMWVGTQWDRLGDSYTQASKIDEAVNSGSQLIQVYEDQEGKKFVAASFGAAGTWMLHNLAVTKYADQTPISSYTYPNAVGSASKPSGFRRENGYLYTWKSVVKAEPIAANHQGICPNGWHLPTDAEWSKLSEVIYTNYSDYSFTNQNTAQWQSAWNTKDLYIAEAIPGAVASIAVDPSLSTIGLGTILKDMCAIEYNLPIKPQGLSKQMKDKGTNLELTGFVSNGTPYNYGRMAYLWSVSSVVNPGENQESRYAHIRYVSAHETGLGRDAASKEDYLSVRCVKN